MRQVVEFPLAGGGGVLIEVDEAASGSATVRGWGDGQAAQVVKVAERSFDQAIARVRPAAQELVNQIRSLIDPPDEIEVEFGLELSADAGAFIAKLGAAANFRVSLTWKKP